MTPQSTHLSALLYQALAEPIGLLLRTGDPHRAKQRLYAARATAADPLLSSLQIRVVDLPDGDLVLCKREPKLQ